MRFRLQERGPITDVIPLGDDNRRRRTYPAMVICRHGTWWEEGGIACRECLAEWRGMGWRPGDPAPSAVVGIGLCWQCSHPVEDHLPEEQGCTHPDCACAQVPEA